MEKPALPTYPTYKPAGVPWLQQVPQHWEVVPHRALFTEVKEEGQPEDEMLSVTIGRGVLKQAEHLATTTKKDSSRKDKSTYKRVAEGDIVYNKMRAWQGAFGMSRYRGIVSPAYVVQRPTAKALPEFYHYLLRTPLFAKEAERNSYGLASDIWNLRPEHFKNIFSVCPPLAEQHLIIRYLHAVDAKVKRYIRAKRKLIAALQEQKQAIIQRAVTRGLDPKVKLKPSGVEWLGEVPEHWEVVPFRALFMERDEPGLADFEMLSVTIKRGVLRQADYLKNSIKRDISREDRSSYKCVAKGDIVYNKMRAWQGAYGASDYTGLVSPAYVVLKPKDGAHTWYYHHLLRCKAFWPEAEKWSYGLASDIWNLRPEHFRMIVACRPPIEEQVSIVAGIKKETEVLSRAIVDAELAVDRMEEYHTRLIADVVTGAVDVREAAKALPAEEPKSQEPEEPLEDLNLAAEPEEAYGTE